MCSIKDMATVARELQQKFHRVSVSLSDDGQVVRAHLPPMEDLPITLEDPVSLQSYQDHRAGIIAKFGEAPMQGASQQSSAPPPAAVEFKEEYLSLEAFEKDADILATIRSTNYHTHVAVPKGTDASNLDSTTVFIENHNARSRVEIQKGDIVFCLGDGEFQRLEEGQVAKFPYKLLPLTKCRTNNEKDVKSVSEKEGQVLLLGASGVKELMSVEALFTKHNLAVGGRVWGCDRTVPRRGPAPCHSSLRISYLVQ